jgi:hypothetical protein
MSFFSIRSLSFAVIGVSGLLITLLMAGCSTRPISMFRNDSQEASIVQPGEKDILPESLSAFLSANSGMATTKSSGQRWGGNATIEAEPTYFAAIGQPCRRIVVHGGVTTTVMVACETNQDQWYTRPLIVPMRENGS